MLTLALDDPITGFSTGCQDRLHSFFYLIACRCVGLRCAYQAIMLPTIGRDSRIEGAIEILIAAHWLDHFTFCDGSGYRLHWTPLGHQRALLLQQIVQAHGLQESEKAVAGFSSACVARAADSSGLRPPETEFWVLCLRELAIHDPAALQPLMQVFHDWKPANPDEFVQDPRVSPDETDKARSSKETQDWPPPRTSPEL